MKDLHYKYLWLTFGIIYIFTITFLCLMPMERPGSFIPHMDKVTHFFMYVVCSFLFCQIIKNRFWIHVILSIFLFGFFIEIIQEYWGYNRFFEVGDVVANTLGNIAGFLASKKLLPTIVEKIDNDFYCILKRN